MTTIINASPTNGLVQTADGSGVLKVQSNGVTTNALAWVNFNGTTSPGTIRAQYNVSSVTRSTTGNYTINFTSALADANYVTNITCKGGGASITGNVETPATGSVYIVTIRDYVEAYADSSIICVSVFGN